MESDIWFFLPDPGILRWFIRWWWTRFFPVTRWWMSGVPVFCYRDHSTGPATGGCLLYFRHSSIESRICCSGSILPAVATSGDHCRQTGLVDRTNGRANPSPTGDLPNIGKKNRFNCRNLFRLRMNGMVTV